MEVKEENKDNLDSQEKPIRCEVCARTWSTASQLKRHMFSHGSAQFPCNLCNALLRHPESLRNHTCKGSNQCDVCSRICPSASELKQHMFSHGTKQFQCHQCRKRYRHPKTLKHHVCKGLNGSKRNSMSRDEIQVYFCQSH